MTMQQKMFGVGFFLSIWALPVIAQAPAGGFTVKPGDVPAVKQSMKTSADQVAQQILAAEKAAPGSPVQLDIEPVVRSYYAAVAHLAAHKPLQVAAAAAESARTDKQIAASSSSSSGTTSTVDRPGIATLLGFALEHGAITQSVQNNTVTFSSSPYAIATWLGGGDTDINYGKFANTYGRVGFSANFNLTDASNPTTSATRKQLNEWTAKVRLGKDHSGRSKDAMLAFKQHLAQPMQNLANSQSAILAGIFGADASFVQIKTSIFQQVTSYLNNHAADSDAAKQTALSQQILDTAFDLLQNVILSNEMQSKLGSFIEAYDAAAAQFIARRPELDAAIAALSKLPSFTFVYAQEQPSVGNNYSVFKLVYAQSPPNSMQLTVNVSGSLYHHPNPSRNQDTFRDFTSSVELLQKIGRSPFLRDPGNKDQIALSFSGRYQRMPENQGIPGKKADIAVAGGKFEIPVAPGVSFPISVTYANATELIKEAHVSGNFGISFDLDKLKALVSK
jgi:hypothetical protein